MGLLVAATLVALPDHTQALDDPTPPPAGEVGVVDDLTTPYQEVRRRADGSFVADLSAVPVRVQDGNGDWQPIDTNLEVTSNGDLVPGGDPG